MRDGAGNVATRIRSRIPGGLKGAAALLVLGALLALFVATGFDIEESVDELGDLVDWIAWNLGEFFDEFFDVLFCACNT